MPISWINIMKKEKKNENNWIYGNGFNKKKIYFHVVPLCDVKLLIDNVSVLGSRYIIYRI